jgi:4-hydroxybenzoyl-CoA reductase subunit beta
MSMERMPEFKLQQPATMSEAAALLAAEPHARLLAGGTDLVPNLRRGIESPAILISLGAVRDFSDIRFDDVGLTLGAGVTLAELATHAKLARHYPAIGQAARAIAGPGHRSVATLGGNLCLDTRCVFYNQSEWWRATNDHCLKRGGTVCHVAPQGERCHAAFSGDLAPVLLALGAEVELVAAKRKRQIPLVALYRDDGAAHLTLEHGELLSRVLIPAAAASLVCGYRKARVRGAMDFPLAGVACALKMSGGVLRELRVAMTGTNSQPLLLEGTHELTGQTVNEELLSTLAKLVQKQVSPMRTSAIQSNYRRQVACVMAQRLVRELCAASPQESAA